MCRLFGITAGPQRVSATFWLLDAPDSLEAEGRRNADGSGLGYFDERGTPILDKAPVRADRDADFLHAATDATSQTFVGHVRLATVGERAVRNTQPFAMAGRLMAHNGGFGDLAKVEAQLGDYRRLVHGETDSERFFALIVQQIDRHGGDVGAGIAAAAAWIAARLPVTSLNTVVATRDELWALRYPDQHALHVIERPAGAGAQDVRLRSSTSAMRLPGAAAAPTVVVASERLDDEDGWRMLDVGELVHVAADLTLTARIALPDPPARLVPLPTRGPNIDT